MSDKEIMDEIKVGAKKLNDMLDLGLTEETYIRTGGYKNRLDNLEKQRPRLNPKKIKWLLFTAKSYSFLGDQDNSNLTYKKIIQHGSTKPKKKKIR